jgi:pimeloyl-ACP methyl ester carboxylesterase
MRVLYLHGFASSPTSSKAVFFGRKLAAHGVQMITPDLNAPDFSMLTVSRMLRQITPLIEESAEPVTLIGSSLGGFVAVQAAVEHASRVSRLVLLAPALDFSGNRLSQIGDRGLDEWESSNRLEVFHYGYGRMMPVHYELYADARNYDVFNADVAQPAQVFQGRQDTSVDPATVERWAASRPNVELHMLDDDHQLLASLPEIWEKMALFLRLTT